MEMVPWISLLFAVSDMLFIFCFLPETLPQEKRVGPGPGVRGFPLCASAKGDGPVLKLLASQQLLGSPDLCP